MFDRKAGWKVVGAWAAAVLLGAAMGTVGAQAPTPPVKVGFVYVSPIGDAGWTFQHDQGRKQMEAALAGKVQTKYVENVAEGADAERVIRELAQSGNKIIFTTSFGYMNSDREGREAVPEAVISCTRPATRPVRTWASTTRASTRAAT